VPESAFFGVPKIAEDLEPIPSMSEPKTPTDLIEYFTRLVIGAGDALSIATASGRIVYWNEAAAELTGCPVTVAVGARLPDILSTPETLEASWGFHLVTVAAHASGNPLRRRSYATRTYADQAARVHVSSLQIRGPEGAPACFMFSFTSEPLETTIDTPSAPELGLRPREWEVASLMMSGLDTRGISRELGISQATTRTHIRNILQTLGVSSRVQALTRIWSLYGDPAA